MSKTALITGITGQDGTYLTELLHDKGYQVYGLDQHVEQSRYAPFLEQFPEVKLVKGDLGDAKSLIQAVEASRPDEIYNFAAISSPALSFRLPEAAADVNGTAVVRLLEAIRQVGGEHPGIRFFQASSCHLFGEAASSPQTEDTPFHPTSPYAAAKAMAHFMTVNYRETYGLHASCGLLFNHESPRRSLEFVTRKITNSVARIKLGLQKELVLGNLDSERDWGFAGDYVEGMWRMLQQDRADDYVLATGQKHSIKDWLVAAFGHVGINDWQPYVKQDPQFMRAADIGELVGDATKAKTKLGWEPQVQFAELVAMMVEYDLEIETANQKA